MKKVEFYKVPENETDSITFSIRTSANVNEHLEEIAHQVNISKNRIINMMIEYSLNNMVIKDYKYSYSNEVKDPKQQK